MYYASEAFPLHNGYRNSIFCIGNPVIWYSGLAALAGCIAFWVLGKRYRVGEENHCWHWVRADYDNSAAFILLGFLAQYLPWVLVPRGTYIYHYFASVPFLMLGIGYCLWAVLGKKEKPMKIAIGVMLGLSFIAFVIFFPYASGIRVTEGWLDLGKSILRVWY